MLRHVATLLLIAVVATSASRRPEKRLRELGLNPYLQGYTKHQPRPDHGLIRSPEAKAREDYELPTNTFPVEYHLFMIQYLTEPANRAFTFDGQLTARIQVAQPTNSIVMHAWDLTIETISVVKVSDMSSVLVTDYNILLDDRQFFTINLGSALEFNQQYDVTIKYSGLITYDFDGLSRSGYIDENGNQEWLTITNLEPTGARRFMPCYDQPNLKARVMVHLAREPGRTVLSNMPVMIDDGEPVEGLPGWEWVTFQMSPPMSTYLICFSTNKFSSITSLTDIRYKVWARPEFIQYGRYSTDFTPEIVRYYEAFTGVPFMLPKFDQIGMVEFFSGAMENWGLITYLEPYILYNPSVDTSWDKMTVIGIVAHETAHQWFGDVVSPRWWSSLWLNEGFATYFESWSPLALGADLQTDQQFISDTMYPAFRRDASNSHPIYADVDSPSSINNIFDTITYSKGGCMVRFMVNFLGEEKFKTGLNNYENAMAYGAADQEDLFFHLAPQAPPMPNGLTFIDMMRTWTWQQGFPLVTVTRNYAAGTATVNQMKYGTPGTEKWIIPLTYTSGANPNFSDLSAKAWLLPTDTDVTLTGVPGASDWLLLNLKQVGFYRVNYDATNWGLLINYITLPGNAITIDPMNRAQLMDDSMTFADAGMLDYVTALSVTRYLDQETMLLPWTVATDNFVYIRDRVYGTQEGVNIFQDYLRRKMNLVYNYVNGFVVSETDEVATVLNRWTITRWACNVEHNPCNNDGSALLQQWMATADPDNNNPVTTDMRTPAYCAGQRRGGQAEYNFLLARYTNSNSGDEQDRLIIGMGCATDTAMLQAFLDESLTTNVIRQGHALDVLEAVYSHPRGVEMCLTFLLDNWRTLDPLYGGVGYGFRNLANKLNTQAHYDAIRQFRDANAAELGTNNVNQINTALSRVQSRVEWNADNLETVMEFFRQN